MSEGLDKPRRKYFTRCDPKPLRLTERDFAIFRHLYKHRFLNSEQLDVLLDGSSANIKRRLSDLFHTGYIDRPGAQLERYVRKGSAPLVYALGNKGADALSEQDGLRRGRRDWTAKNNSVTRLFIAHTLLTSTINVTFECACKAHRTLKFLAMTEIVAKAPATTQKAANPWRWQVQIPGYDRELGVIPDTAFALIDEQADKLVWFVVEADMGTMPVDRKNLMQTSIRRKLIAYEQIRKDEKANPAKARFPWAPFRVLFVTSSVERCAHMVDSVKELTGGKGSNFFLFTDAQSLLEGDPLSNEFITGTGATTKLIS